MTPADPLPRRVALCDANNFFVSCERLFRPDLAGRPVVVLSANDGCVVSRSDEAKAAALEGSNLDMAEQVVRVCTPPIPPLQPSTVSFMTDRGKAPREP